MNILLITADDLNWDSVGAYGCPTQDTTPNIDSLAADGIRFDHAHVTIAVCQPSRSVMMTGMYPHCSGGEGFFHLRRPGLPTLPEILRKAGYRVGVLGKVPHSTPYADFNWNMTYDMSELGWGRNPSIYLEHALDFILSAQRSSQPFFLMANLHDPHRPFYGNDSKQWYDRRADGRPAAAKPSKVFTPEEVVVPGFLPDLPEVRQEISEYYSSVRRCDDVAGAVIDVLREIGALDETLILFLSDNGMALPFAKTNCYLHSTRTPLIARLPGHSGLVDDRHMVSALDLVPTILELAGIEPPGNVQGRSFLPLLRGESQECRELLFTQFHQTAGNMNYPMRCVQSRRFGYIFNLWSNGSRVFMNESQTGRTMPAMREAAAKDPAIAARIEFFLHRVPEELYDFSADPHALNNRIDDPQFDGELNRLTNALEQWMKETDDPALEAFRNRHSLEHREAYMRQAVADFGGHA